MMRSAPRQLLERLGLHPGMVLVEDLDEHDDADLYTAAPAA